MGAGWNDIPSANLDQIIKALGYSSPDQLPAINTITDAQVETVSQKAGPDAATQLQSARSQQGTPDSPTLTAPTTNFGDGSSLALLVMSLQSKISGLQTTTATEAIKADKADQQAKVQENIKKIQDSIEKMEKASSSGLLGKIFGWIGAGLALIAAAAATVVTGGAAGPIAGLVIAGIAVALMTAQQTGAMDKLMTAMFGDDSKAKMIFSIVLQVAMVAASIASIALSGGASAASTVSSIAKTAELIQSVSAAGAGVSSVASGGATIASGVYTYQATNAQADSKDLEAWLAQLQAQMDNDQSVLQKILQDLQTGTNTSMDMLNSIMDSKSTILQFSSA